MIVDGKKESRECGPSAARRRERERKGGESGGRSPSRLAYILAGHQNTWSARKQLATCGLLWRNNGWACLYIGEDLNIFRRRRRLYRLIEISLPVARNKEQEAERAMATTPRRTGACFHGCVKRQKFNDFVATSMLNCRGAPFYTMFSAFCPKKCSSTQVVL